MFRIQKEAKRIKKELKKIHVEAESEGVRVVVDGEQHVVSIDVADHVDRHSIGRLAVDALSRAMKKSQIVASEKMQAVMGQMGMPTEEGMRGLSS